MQAPSRRPAVRYRSRSEEEEEPKPSMATTPVQEESDVVVEAAPEAAAQAATSSSGGNIVGPLGPALKAAGEALAKAGPAAGVAAAAAAALLGLGLRWRRRRGAQQRHPSAVARKGGHHALANGTAAAGAGKKQRSSINTSAAPPKPGPLSKLKATKDCVPIADGTLAVVRRPIAADNSCLFNSVGYTMHQSKSRAPFLRRVVSNEVSGDPETWSDAFLGMPNAAYCAWINEPHNWGGGIELAILAAHYRREIAAWNIETGEPHVFGEERGFKRQVGIIYSGTHYDALAITARPNASSWEEDVTEFNPRTRQGKQIVEAMRTLVRLNNKQLAAASKAAAAAAPAGGKEAAGDSAIKQPKQEQQQAEKQPQRKKQQQEEQQQLGRLRCGSCAEEFSGQQAAVAHAQATGHSEFSEV